MEILISEDDFVSRNLLKTMLTAFGHEVIETENGREAWTVLQRHNIQMVISDWMMPEMDGLELCHKIRSEKQGFYVYIIMLTAKDQKSDLVDVFLAGADDYIPKPFDPEELRARVMTGIRVTELQQRHNNLANILIESRNKVRIVLDSLKEEIVSLDREMKIVSVNDSFARRLEVRPDEAVGRHYFKDKPNQEYIGKNDEILKMVRSVFAEGKSESGVVKVVDENGADAYRRVTCLPISDEHDQVFQTVIVSQDITEDRRKSEEIKSLNYRLIEKSEQIEAKNQKLQNTLRRLEDTQAQMLQSEKMASIGQLAAGVAHEINNPTGFVRSNLKTLSDYQEDLGALIEKYHRFMDDFECCDSHFPNEQTKSKFEAIRAYEKDIDLDFLLEDIVDLIGDCREGTNRIKKIVIDLKNFAHPGEDTVQTIDINRGLESTLNVVNNEIKYKATVHKDFGVIPTVRGYPQQLNQVFMNILVNAAQAIDKKGEIHIQTRENNGFIQVRISDSGCGISEKNRNKIFDPFFTTKGVGKGTGLGMNIAYNIVQKHNGSIDFQSKTGQGTTFTICLPAACGKVQSSSTE